MQQLFKKMTYKKILCVGVGIIFMLSFFHISHLNMLVVIPDEFGYWANAAVLAGKDWSGVSSLSPYYSFGYSFLLVPLFWIFSSTSMMYKAAIVMNVIFYTIAYLLSFFCFARIFKDKNRNVIAILCSIVALYGANLFNVNIAWVEPYIYMLFWLSVYILLSINEKPKNYKMVLFAFILIYMYTVHQRALGVVVCGILTILILTFTKKITIKQLLIFIVMIGVCFLSQIIIKNGIVSILWNNPISSYVGNVNDYGGQLSKIIDILTSPLALLKFVRGILSRYLYLIISTASIIVFGLIYTGKKFFVYIKEKKEFPVIELYCFFSLLFSIAISSIYFYQSQRLDTIIYGRYSEFVVAPLLVFGLCYLLDHKFSIKQFLINIGYMICVSLFIYQYMSKPESFLQIGTVNAAIFYDASTYSFRFAAYIYFGIMFCFLFYFLWTRKKYIFKTTSICMLILFWLFSSYYVIKNEIIVNQNYAANLTIISEKISNIEHKQNIYFVYDDNPNNKVKNNQLEILQFLMPNTNMKIVDKEKVANLKGNYYLAIPLSLDFDFTDYTIIAQANEMVVTLPNDSQLLDRLDDEYIIDEKIMYSEVNNTDKEGLVAVTQNLALNKGKYVIDLDLEISNAKEQNIGYLQIISDQGEVLNEEIVYCGENSFSTTFDFQDKYVSISVYSNGNAKINLNKISYTINKKE